MFRKLMKQGIPAISEKALQSICQIPHSEWVNRKVHSEPIYVSIHWPLSSHPDQEFLRLEPNEVSSKSIVFELQPEDSLPKMDLTAFAPSEILGPAEIKYVFDPKTKPWDRRQRLSYWDLNGVFVKELERMNSEPWQPLPEKVLTASVCREFGRGREIRIDVTAKTKTTFELLDGHDEALPRYHTHIHTIAIEVTHSPARIKVPHKNTGIGE